MTLEQFNKWRDKNYNRLIETALRYGNKLVAYGKVEHLGWFFAYLLDNPIRRDDTDFNIILSDMLDQVHLELFHCFVEQYLD